MQKILIEISHQDQVYVEEECTKKGLSLSRFFEMMLNDYRSPQTKKVEGCNKVVNKEEKPQEEPLKEESEEVEKVKQKRSKRKNPQ